MRGPLNVKHRVFGVRCDTRQGDMIHFECQMLDQLASHYQPLCSYGHFSPLNAELNPICHLQALLGAHHILHVSRIRVNIRSWK